MACTASIRPRASSHGVFDSPDHHEIQPRALAPRQAPDGRSSVVDDKQEWGEAVLPQPLRDGPRFAPVGKGRSEAYPFS